MRRVFGAMLVVAVAVSVSVAQDAAKKPAEKKAGASHAAAAKSDAAKSEGSSYVGTWKLNTDKSQYPDASMKPKSATLHITKWDANTIAWNYTATDASGKTSKASYSAPNDGKPHKVTNSDPNMMSMGVFKATGNDVDITWQDPKGNTIGTEHTTLSADGKSFNDTEMMKGKDGKEVNFTEVYDKATGAATNAAKKNSEKPATKK